MPIPPFREEYLPVPVVHEPRLDDWHSTELNWFNLGGGYGFSKLQLSTGKFEVLLPASNRVSPVTERSNARNLDIRIAMTGSPIWMGELQPNQVVFVRLAEQHRSQKKAQSWFLESELRKIDRVAILEEQQQLWQQLPFFQIVIENRRTKEIVHEVYRTNCPFKGMREWLRTKPVINTSLQRVACHLETNEETPTKIRFDEYESLRKYVTTNLPKVLQSL